VGNILRRFGIPPAPKRGQHTNWKEFIRQHLAMAASISLGRTCRLGSALAPRMGLKSRITLDKCASLRRSTYINFSFDADLD
jgi:hypothetical protein